MNRPAEGAAAVRILNVDDSPGALYVKSRVLRLAGYEVAEAVTGTEALEKVQALRPALVLLDVRLPDIDGLEVCRRIKADAGLAGVLVLQTSATFIDPASRVLALQGGADSYLSEPVEPAELLANVNALMRLRHAEQALREAARRKDRFLAMLAHELRNPLQPLQSAVALLARDAQRLGPQQMQAAAIALRQTAHLSRLVDDLLDVARINFGKVRLRQEPVELVAVLTSALEATRGAIDARGLQLNLQLQEGAMWVKGDALRLAQVFGNLLSNAAKFTEPGGHIALETGVQGAWAWVRVADDGCGIDAQALERVFDLFAQEDESLHRQRGGLGIGLSVVRQLVELHGGTVTVHSEGVGQGCVFEVRLPLYEAPAQAGVQPAAGPVATAPRRVLVVDDNQDAAETMSLLLQADGHRVEVAHSGEQALVQAQTLQPEVVLLDIGLPGMSGFEVARALQTLPGLRPAVLVALTGYGSEADRQRMQEAGFDHHLVKPADLRQVAGILAATPAPPSPDPRTS